MTIHIETRIEARRGCGFRKPGGIYLVGPSEGLSCCKLPWPLTVCPTCGAGIHPARGWTWVDCGKLFEADHSCNKILELASACVPWNEAVESIPCPLARPKEMGRAGLIWIGEKFYPTPLDFLTEAHGQGISRRISSVPKAFELGKTWVLLAHRKGYTVSTNPPSGELIWKPAIFSVFKPKAIEYVIRGTETDDELDRIVKRGLTPVEVNPRRARK